MNVMCKKWTFFPESTVDNDSVILLSYGFDMVQKNIERSCVVIMDILGV